jgi:hypothetical protein
MRASKFFASRLVQSNQVQQRLEELSHEMRLHQQQHPKPSDDDEGESNSLVYNKVALDKDEASDRNTEKNSFQDVSEDIEDLIDEDRKSNRRPSSPLLSSIQVVTNMDVILDSSEPQQQDPRATIKSAARIVTPSSLVVSPPNNRSKPSILLRSTSSSSSLSFGNRPRLPTATSFRSQSSSHRSASTSRTTTASISNTAVQTQSRPPPSPTAYLQRITTFLTVILPIYLSIGIMILATATALIQTLWLQQWTPLTFFALMGILGVGTYICQTNITASSSEERITTTTRRSSHNNDIPRHRSKSRSPPSGNHHHHLDQKGNVDAATALSTRRRLPLRQASSSLDSNCPSTAASTEHHNQVKSSWKLWRWHRPTKAIRKEK